MFYVAMFKSQVTGVRIPADNDKAALEVAKAIEEDTGEQLLKLTVGITPMTQRVVFEA